MSALPHPAREKFMHIFMAVVAMAASLAAGVAWGKETQTSVDLLIRTCSQPSADERKMCTVQVKLFREDYKKAYRKDYGAQRNVAFCLGDMMEDGCDGAVRTDPIAACAWRMVVLASGSPEVGITDTWRYQGDCGKKTLTNAQRRNALDQAEAIFKFIYRKEMPLGVLLKANSE